MARQCVMNPRRLFIFVTMLGSVTLMLVVPRMQMMVDFIHYHSSNTVISVHKSNFGVKDTTIQTFAGEDGRLLTPSDNVSFAIHTFNLSTDTIQNKFQNYKCFNNTITDINDLHICGDIASVSQNMVFFTTTYYSKDMSKLRNVVQVWASMRPSVTPVLFLTDNQVYKKQR